MTVSSVLLLQALISSGLTRAQCNDIRHYTMVPPDKDQVFQFRLSASERKMLNALAEAQVETAGDVLRTLIRKRFELLSTPVGVMPPGLDEHGQAAWRIVAAFTKRHKLTNGVQVYSTQQWRQLGHSYGIEPESKLIVGHEGTELDTVLNPGWSDTKLLPQLEAELKKHHLFIQSYIGYVAICSEGTSSSVATKARKSAPQKTRLAKKKQR